MTHTERPQRTPLARGWAVDADAPWAVCDEHEGVRFYLPGKATYFAFTQAFATALDGMQPDVTGAPKQWHIAHGKRSNQMALITPEGDEWHGITASDARFLVKVLNARERKLAALTKAAQGGAS